MPGVKQFVENNEQGDPKSERLISDSRNEKQWRCVKTSEIIYTRTKPIELIFRRVKLLLHAL